MIPMTTNRKYQFTKLAFFAFIAMLLVNSCAFKFVSRSKNIEYTKTDTKRTAQKLNVFAPAKKKTLKPVLIFVYGGSWNSGRRGLYSFFGSRIARKGVVMVIPDYPKSPAAGYDEMAEDIALAVKWTKENIEKYGGDPDKIFISGHSAGGHLAALVTIKEDYFKKLKIENPVKGFIGIDAAGLDMYGYLKGENFADGESYLKTFSNDPAVWKQASPIYYLHNDMPPMLIYQGEKTYPSIATGNAKFTDSLKKYDVKYSYKILPDKKHVPMITQFLNPYNERYKEIISFMKEN